MAAVDPTVIAARVAINVHRPASDPAVLDAVNAAIIMVATDTGRADADPPLEIPDDPMTRVGLVGLSTTLFLDELAPGTATVAVADGSFDPIGRPRDPYGDRRTWFDRLVVGAPGVA